MTRRTGLNLAELAASFESIGDNCEFGLVQRRCDTEPLGLLRFSGSFSNDVVRGIEQEFEGIGEPEDITPTLEGDDGKREFMIRERKYGLVYHTFVYEGERTIDLMRQQEATRLKFLRRKFVEEIDAGEKIFVFRRATPVPESEILPLFLALNRRRPNTLLWVVPEEPGRPSGTVEGTDDWLAEGLHRSFRSRRQRARFLVRGLGADLRARVPAASADASAGMSGGAGDRRPPDVKPDVLLFDWDNTLVDGWTGITAALNAAFGAFDKPLWTVTDTKNRVGYRSRKAFR